MQQAGCVTHSGTETAAVAEGNEWSAEAVFHWFSIGFPKKIHSFFILNSVKFLNQPNPATSSAAVQ
jgi:hypothetical protein